MSDNSIAYVAVYGDVDSALSDLDALGELHHDEIVGKYDAAVIDQDQGKPHIVKRVDSPKIDLIPEMFGRGVLPSGELKDAATELDPGEAALVAVGEPTFGKAFDKAVTHADKVAKQEFDSSADELANELRTSATG
jgi:hypothetical protein